MRENNSTICSCRLGGNSRDARNSPAGRRTLPQCPAAGAKPAVQPAALLHAAQPQLMERQHAAVVLLA